MRSPISITTWRPRGPVAILTAIVLLVVPAAMAVDGPPDTDITIALNDELWVDGVVDANSVDVTVSEGIVTLVGSVDTLLAKRRAERIAESIVGVRAVIDRLEVDPPVERNDAEVAQAVSRALLGDPVTDAFEIDVAVAGGVVTLSGEVESWQERILAETVAASIRGVVGVTNALRVVYADERSDDEIEADIEGRLANDVRVDDVLIDVAVTDGRVTLTGTVGSLAEKNRAISDAWVAGTASVDGGGLELDWWARDAMRRKSAYVDRTDDEIRQAVKDAFVYDPRVMSFEPKVAVSEGTVTLTGVVDNLAAKRAAEEDARNVTGVWRVRNHLKVRPTRVVDDEELEGRIADAFFDDPYLERWDVDIDANLGVVYLSGKVNTSFEKRHAAAVATNVRGVVDVVNNLDFEYQWEWRPDWEIRADIREQLWWSPFVDSDSVMVVVDDGVATLTGEVDTWSERDAAVKNAFDGGAKDVRDELRVSFLSYGPYPTTLDPPMYPYGF